MVGSVRHPTLRSAATEPGLSRFRMPGILPVGLRAALFAWVLCAATAREASAGGWIDRGFVQNSTVNRTYVFPGPTYFAITQFGRLFRSTDARNWTPVFQFPSHGATGSSAMISDGASLLMGFDGQPEQAPLIHSTDGGLTWRPTGLSNAVFLARVPGGGVLAWTPDGFYRADGPEYRWTRVPTSWNGANAPPYRIVKFQGQIRSGRIVGLPIVQTVPFTPSYHREAWIAQVEGVQDTLAWTQVKDSVPEFIAPWDTTLLTPTPQGVLQSDDDGRTWHPRSPQVVDFIRESGGLLVGTRFFQGLRRTSFSRDGGISWQDSDAFDGRGVADLFLRGDTVFAAVDREGVLAARLGETKVLRAGRGMWHWPVESIFQHGGALFGFSGYHLGRYENGSAEWSNFYPDRVPYMQSLASDGRRLYACDYRLLRSPANAPITSWDTLGTSSCDMVADGGGKAWEVRSVIDGISDAKYFLTFLGPDGPSRDINLGVGYAIGSLRALAVQGDTAVAAFNRLHVSTQPGSTIAVKASMDSTIALLFHGGELYRVRRDANACLPYCLDRSADLGGNWTPSGGNPPGRYRLKLASSKLGLVAASDLGVFASPDRGLTWYPLGDWPSGAWAYGIHAAGDQIAVGHEDGGIRFLDLRTVSLAPAGTHSPRKVPIRSRTRFLYQGTWNRADGRSLRRSVDAPRE